MAVKIGVIVAKNSEDMEVIVPVDIWRRAGITVDILSLSSKKVTVLQNGIKITADKTFASVNASQYHALYLPGGKGYQLYKRNKKLTSQVRSFSADPKKWVLAICAAPEYLGEIGVLEGVRATGYPGYTATFKQTLVDDPVVVHGKFITAMGPALPLPFALTVVELLSGKETRDKVASEVLFHRLSK